MVSVIQVSPTWSLGRNLGRKLKDSVNASQNIRKTSAVLRNGTFILFQCLQRFHLEWHFSVPIKQPQSDLWDCKKLKIFERS